MLVVTAGKKYRAYEPDGANYWYETGSSTGCFYKKCPNEYAYVVSNNMCKQGHRDTGRHAGGWPECPHGHNTGMVEWGAHCYVWEEGGQTIGYRAPCGRTTRMEGEQWGYVNHCKWSTTLRRSIKVVTAGKLTYAYQPSQLDIGYETGDMYTGCYYHKCANGYAHRVDNTYCKQGHRTTGRHASGYPSCPHGYILESAHNRKAHCCGDSGYETVLGDRAYKEVSRGRISSLWIQCAHSAEYRGYTTYP